MEDALLRVGLAPVAPVMSAAPRTPSEWLRKTLEPEDCTRRETVVSNAVTIVARAARCSDERADYEFQVTASLATVARRRTRTPLVGG